MRENLLPGSLVHTGEQKMKRSRIRVFDYNRDMVSNLQDFYMTTVSNDMNQVMKVLAIIATIFIPLTFIAGVFGMNFEHMPELKVKGACYITLFVMVVLAVLMAIYFKNKKWL